MSSPRRRTAEPRSGASHSKTRIGDKLRAYWANHRSVARESLLRLLRTPVQSLLTWLVVAIALALPAVLYLALAQFQAVGENWQTQPRISVFLKMGARDEAAAQLRERWSAMSAIAAVDYISPDEAIREFQETSGLGRVLETLDQNPLPGVLVVHPAPNHSAPEQLEALQATLAEDLLVDDARLDMDWVRRLHQMMAIGQRMVAALGALLALGVLLVIGNTIGLAIESRRDEIVIVKLVGGTNSFVRRPFLYTGFWYGFGGGLFAWLLLLAGVQWLSEPIARLADLYQSNVRLQGLDARESLALLLGSGVLGLSGAALAVGKHLHTIEPN
ncbi:permease-like cell division protein FtsX [Gilvimarinus sp. F26214L]|uniref:permease-like cell division protein FtsX n=1 Tax=Gilvimarinus sp. DZF01 TaxID=3461371 RepID=UPI0040458B77